MYAFVSVVHRNGHHRGQPTGTLVRVLGKPSEVEVINRGALSF